MTLRGRVVRQSGYFWLVDCPEAEPALRTMALTIAQIGRDAQIGDEVELSYMPHKSMNGWGWYVSGVIAKKDS